MHPNTMQRTKTWVYGRMGRIGCVRYDKSRCDFVARTFALIVPSHPILDRVSCSYKTITNAPKHYYNAPKHEFRVQCSGLDAFVAKQFTLFCIEFHVVKKRSQMHPNTLQRTKTWVYGPMGRIVCVRCEKSWCDFMARTFLLIAPIYPVLHRVSCSYEMIPNAPKH